MNASALTPPPAPKRGPNQASCRQPAPLWQAAEDDFLRIGAKPALSKRANAAMLQPLIPWRTIHAIEARLEKLHLVRRGDEMARARAEAARRLTALFHEGLPQKEIAARLGVHPSTVSARLAALDLTRHEKSYGNPIAVRGGALDDGPVNIRPAKRRCLAPGCGKLFDSQGPHNRRCGQCRRTMLIEGVTGRSPADESFRVAAGGSLPVAGVRF